MYSSPYYLIIEQVSISRVLQIQIIEIIRTVQTIYYYNVGVRIRLDHNK